MSAGVLQAADVVSLPQWTSAGAAPARLRAFYPLGIDSATQALERTLFDGITSQTPHPRYYAFYAWALTRFRQAVHRQGPTLGEKEFQRRERRWVARLEAVLRVATMITEPSILGMFGKTTAEADGVPPQTGRWPLPDTPRYPTTGLNFHIGPLVALGCGTHREGHRGEFRAGSGAQVLADAMDAECRRQRGGQAALSRLMQTAMSDVKSIMTADIHTLAPALALGPVTRQSPLHKPLIQILFASLGATPPETSSFAWNRRQALTLCLDIARQTNGRVPGAAIQIVRRVILTGYLAPRQVYSVLPGHERTLAGLRRLYERHLLQLALYGLWRDVVYALDNAPGQALSLPRLRGIISAAVSAGIQNRSVEQWLGLQPLDVSVADLIERCAAERRRLRTTPWNSGEIKLAEAVVASPSEATYSTAAPSFALLLCVAQRWLRATRNGKRPKCARWHAIGGRERLALDVVCADVKARHELSGADYLAWALEAYVTGQSLRATVAKGPQTRSGEYVYFIVPDSGGYRINHPSRMRSYLQIDSPRLRYSLGMLEELGLITNDDDFSITDDGIDLLDELAAIRH